jgi:hypothetical protein
VVPSAAVMTELNCCQTSAPAKIARNTTDAMNSDSPTRGDVRSGSISGVQVENGLRADGAVRSTSTNTKVVQNPMCTMTDTAAPMVPPMIPPTGVPAMSWPIAIATTEIGNTMA